MTWNTGYMTSIDFCFVWDFLGMQMVLPCFDRSVVSACVGEQIVLPYLAGSLCPPYFGRPIVLWGLVTVYGPPRT